MTYEISAHLLQAYKHRLEEVDWLEALR